MLAIAVEFLTGRFVATAHDDRTACEWPPHPARLYSALVATWAAQDPPDPAERDVLVQLESAAPPHVCASEATPRTPVTHFVPVNDASVVSSAWYQRRAGSLEEKLATLEAALDRAGGDLDDNSVRRALSRVDKERDVTAQVTGVGNTPVEHAVALLPERRGRQGREYPSVTPDEPRVVYAWPDLVLDDVSTTVLDTLLARVSRLGHSSSLVSARVATDTPPSTWVPATDGDVTLRWVGRGQLDALESAYSRHQGSRPRTLPARGVRYRGPQHVRAEPEPTLRSSMSGDWFVVEFEPRDRRLPLSRAVDVARALRGAVLAHADAMPEALTGHRSDTSPSQEPHVAFVALPFVGHAHASGRLLGAAVLLPPDEAVGAGAPQLRQLLLRALGRWRTSSAGVLELRLGAGGVVRGRLLARDASSLASLRRVVWAGPSKQWASVTPVALPRHPGDLSHGSELRRRRAWARAEDQVRLACEHSGLPEPEIAVSRQPLLAGVPPAGRFPPFVQLDRAQGRDTARVQVHAALRFPHAVEGPVLIGSGRYVGLGLLRPLSEERAG